MGWACVGGSQGDGVCTILILFNHALFYLSRPQLHEQGEPPAVTRMDRYQQLTQYAFGKKWGACCGLAEVAKKIKWFVCR